MLTCAVMSRSTRISKVARIGHHRTLALTNSSCLPCSGGSWTSWAEHSCHMLETRFALTLPCIPELASHDKRSCSHDNVNNVILSVM